MTKTASFDPRGVGAELADACQAALAAQALGGRAAEAYAVRSNQVRVRCEKGDVSLASSGSEEGFGLRVVDEGRLGFASTNQLDPASLEALAADACGLWKASPKDEHHVLPPPPAAQQALDLHDGAFADWDVERVVALGAELCAEITARDARISIDTLELSVSESVRTLRSTTGVAAEEADQALGLSVFGMAVDGDDVGGFDALSAFLRKPEGFETRVAALADEFAQNVLGNLGAGSAESYHGPVLFSPEVLLGTFVGPLVQAASGMALQRGRSALAGKLGQRVADVGLTIRDDPTDLELAGAGAFDREGQSASGFTIVDSGVFQGVLHNAYSGHVDGVASTGHASGGSQGVPGIAPAALVVEPGSGGGEAELLEALGRGLYVQRFSGTVDPASGDFSGVAKSARWVEDGRVVRSVRETLLAGNAFRLLEEIALLSTERRACYGSARLPWALIDGVSVTAG